MATRADILKQINAQLKQQFELTQRLNIETEPAILQARLRLKLDQQRASIDLQQKMNDALKRYGQLVEPALNADDKRVNALRSINQDLATQEQTLLRIREASKPQALQQKADLDRQVEEAQKQYRRKLRRAKGEGGPLADLGDQLGESGLPGKALLQKLQKVFNASDKALGGSLSSIGKSLGLDKIGAALGEAAPFIGAFVAGAELIAPVLKKAAAAPFNAIAGGISNVSGALNLLSGSIGPLAAFPDVISHFGDSIKKAGDSLPFGSGAILSGIGEGFGNLGKSLSGLMQTFAHLGSTASPGQATLFQRALKDTEATVGQRLVPILELMTKAIRLVGDVLNTVLPSWGEMRDALAPLSGILDDVRVAITPVAYLIKNGLVLALQLLASTLKTAAQMVHYLLGPLIDFGKASGLKLKSSIGAAPMQASTSSIDEYARKVYTGALMGTAGKSAADKTAENTFTIAGLLHNIWTWLQGLPGKLMGKLSVAFPDLTGKIGKLYDEITSTIAGAFSELPNVMREAFEKAYALLTSALPGPIKAMLGIKETEGGTGTLSPATARAILRHVAPKGGDGAEAMPPGEAPLPPLSPTPAAPPLAPLPRGGDGGEAMPPGERAIPGVEPPAEPPLGEGGGGISDEIGKAFDEITDAEAGGASAEVIAAAKGAIDAAMRRRDAAEAGEGPEASGASGDKAGDLLREIRDLLARDRKDRGESGDTRPRRAADGWIGVGS